MSLLTGLGKFGLKYLEDADLFEEEKKKENQSDKAKPAVTVMAEEDYLFDKTYECPVCYGSFKERTVRTGKAKLMRTDLDLRPVYDNFEPLKYDVVVCPHCGYAALSRFFTGMPSFQQKAIKEMMATTNTRPLQKKDTYSYDEAVDRYKLTLAYAIVKHAKTSEKAYVCLKGGWLLRSMGEYLRKVAPDQEQKWQELKEQEDEFLKNALEGFLTARQTENFPICGMEQFTLDYLVSVLAMNNEQYEVAAKLISGILTARNANNRIKEKARDLREQLIIKVKGKSVNK